MKKYDETVNAFISNVESNGCSDETVKTYSNIFRYYRNFLMENNFEDAVNAQDILNGVIEASQRMNKYMN